MISAFRLLPLLEVKENFKATEYFNGNLMSGKCISNRRCKGKRNICFGMLYVETYCMKVENEFVGKICLIVFEIISQ
jgi:hypothetical protein